VQDKSVLSLSFSPLLIGSFGKKKRASSFPSFPFPFFDLWIKVIESALSSPCSHPYVMKIVVLHFPPFPLPSFSFLIAELEKI